MSHYGQIKDHRVIRYLALCPLETLKRCTEGLNIFGVADIPVVL